MSAVGRWRCWRRCSRSSSWRSRAGADCALAGIVVAFAVLVVFLLPALRDGAPALPAALVASAAILFAVIYLAHGISLRTSAALLGTLTAMLLSAFLSWGAIELTHLTGLSEDHNNEVAAYMGNVDQGPVAGRFHHRFARRAQRRHDHPGLRGVRTHVGHGSRREIFLRGMPWAVTT